MIETVGLFGAEPEFSGKAGKCIRVRYSYPASRNTRID
jgi:hypothetical protein